MEPTMIQKVVMDKVRVAVATHLREDLPFLANHLIVDELDLAARDTVLRLRSFVLGIGKEEHVVRYPATWRDARRLEWRLSKPWWMPRYVHRRLKPVNYTEVRRDVFAAVCPHMNIAANEDHVQWMIQQGGIE